MIFLTIETSSPQGSLSLWKGAECLFYKHWLRSRSHGEIITSALEDAFFCSDIQLDKIEHLVVDHGPGSFTGLRVGINVAKTLSYSHNLPIYSYSSTEVLAESFPLKNKPLQVLINAQSNECFCQSFKPQDRHWKSLKPPQLIQKEEWIKSLKKQHHVIGDGQKVFHSEKSLYEKAFLYPNAYSLACLHLRNFKLTQPKDWNSLQALYLKSSAAEEKLMLGMLKSIPKL